MPLAKDHRSKQGVFLIIELFVFLFYCTLSGHSNTSVITYTHAGQEKCGKKSYFFRLTKIAIRGSNVPVFTKQGPSLILLRAFRGNFSRYHLICLKLVANLPKILL